MEGALEQEIRERQTDRQKIQRLTIFFRKDNERRTEVEGALELKIREIETDRQKRQILTIFFRKDNERKTEVEGELEQKIKEKIDAQVKIQNCIVIKYSIKWCKRKL